MDYKKFPKPIIDIFNALEEWSFNQEISFERDETSNKGFSWKSNYGRDFEFVFYFQFSSPKTTDIFTYGTRGNPEDLITYNSSFHNNYGAIHHPYTIDINKRIISIIERDFEKWLHRIKVFEESSLFGGVNSKLYEKEFYTQFEIINEDLDSDPFNLETQVLLENFITKTTRLLEEQIAPSNELQEIINEGNKLKKDIPLSSKKRILRKFAQWYSRIRPFGAQLSAEVIKFWVTEGLKTLISS